MSSSHKYLPILPSSRAEVCSIHCLLKRSRDETGKVLKSLFVRKPSYRGDVSADPASLRSGLRQAVTARPGCRCMGSASQENYICKSANLEIAIWKSRPSA